MPTEDARDTPERDPEPAAPQATPCGTYDHKWVTPPPSPHEAFFDLRHNVRIVCTACKTEAIAEFLPPGTQCGVKFGAGAEGPLRIVALGEKQADG